MEALSNYTIVPITYDWESPSFDTTTFERISKIENSKDPIILDLSSLGFATPAGMLGIIMLSHSLGKRKRNTVFVKTPLSHDVTGYMARMGFFKAIKRIATIIEFDGKRIAPIEPPTMLHTRGSPVLLEITRIRKAQDTVDAVKKVTAKASEILRRDFSFSDRDISDFGTALSEICDNVCLHSRTWGLAAIQSYSNKVRMAVFDLGVGIRKSLTGRARELGEDWNDSQSILKSVEFGLSRFNDEGRGRGLHGVLETVRKWEGTIHIRSGAGKTIFSPWFRNGRTVQSIPCFPGTQIAITIPK